MPGLHPGVGTQKGTNPKMRKKRHDHSDKADHWDLNLYITGCTPRATVACANLRQILLEYAPGMFSVHVVDLRKHPERAKEDGIVAIPTLIGELPSHHLKIVGDFSDTDRVLTALGIRPT